MTPPRILLVDDEPPNRDMLSRRLERRGFTVETAASGPEALTALEQGAWSAVLLDVQMPGMSGLEVLTTIREKWSAAALPVIMVTARDGSENIVHALELGANDYLTKPVDFPVAVARLKTQIERRDAEERLRASEERYALAARGANDGLWDWDLVADELHVSDRFRAIVGSALPEPLPSQAYLGRIHGEDRARVEADLTRHLDGESPHFQSEHRLADDAGGYRWVLARGMAVRDASGRPVRMAGSLSDITVGKVVDRLTGLPNRMLLHDRLAQALQPEPGRSEAHCAVLLLDVDGFKLVNDGHGRDHGDDLLRGVARRLERSLRLTDSIARSSELAGDHLLARLGGDEFVVVLQDVPDAVSATRVAERLQRVLTRPFTVAGKDLFISASMGIALSGPGATPDDLLRNADTAMNRARLQGRGRVEVFDMAMRQEVIERLQLDAALRVALDRHEFIPHYQPIVHLGTGRLVGFEALMRWRRDDGRLVSPALFIPTLEQTGLIVPVGRRFTADVCQQLRAWHDAFPEAVPPWVNINFTGLQFAEPDVLETLLATLRDSGLGPEDLVVEITESMAISDFDRAAETLKRFRAAGLRVALDDFGTGYSSLSCLHELPISGIKLDRSFVGSDRRHPAILRAVLHLAEELGLSVTAEGVETAGQHEQLRDLGCGYAQGYHFAKPLDAAAAGELIRRQACWLPDPLQSTPAA